MRVKKIRRGFNDAPAISPAKSLVKSEAAPLADMKRSVSGPPPRGERAAVTRGDQRRRISARTIVFVGCVASLVVGGIILLSMHKTPERPPALSPENRGHGPSTM